MNCAKDEIAHLTQILTENNVTEEEKADIEKQTTALNTAINKYKNIIKELEDKEKTALAAQDQEVEKLFTEIAENKSACSKIQLSDDETIYKEAKKIDSSIKKLLKLDDSEELEQMGLAIPEPSKITRELLKRGFDVDPGVLTSSEAADSIYKALTKNR